VTDPGLSLATDNAAAMWTALGSARSAQILRRPGFLYVDGGERVGVRLLVLTDAIGAHDEAELIELARRRPGRTIVEDPFGRLDLGQSFLRLRLSPRYLPVMARGVAPLPPPALRVVPVTGPDQLATAEQIVVSGFPMEHLLPYRPGEMFPAELVHGDGVALYLAVRDGVPVGACLSIVDSAVAGLYWVTTAPEHRSVGVGRSLMHGVLNALAPRPVTLTAARAGIPLYDSLGFTVVGTSTWWT